MSYAFQMTFLEVPKEKVMSVCTKVVNQQWKNSDKILEENLVFIPSVRNCCQQDISVKDYNISPWKETDRFWLKNLFLIEFLYWEQYGLLGILGADLSKLSGKSIQIYFQNSTDQNYEYKEWNGISAFEEVVKEICTLPDTEIRKIVSCCDDEDELDMEYYRKTAVYQKIYDMLDLKSWLWQRNGKMLNFTMGPTKNEVEWIQLHNQLIAMLVKHEFLTQEPE